MSFERAQALFDAADEIDDFAREYLFRAKADFDAGELDAERWKAVRRNHRKIVVAAARIEDLGHDELGAVLDASLPGLKRAIDDLKTTAQTLANAKRVVSGLAGFASLGVALAALSVGPSPATVAGLANAVLKFVALVREMDQD